MKAIFIDSSAVIAVLLEEPQADAVRDVLRRHGSLYASGLLEAEVRSVSSRERLEPERVESTLAYICWLMPERALGPEITRVLETGVYLRGADLWHLACAVHLVGKMTGVPFLTLDNAQAAAAARLGFKVLPISKRSPSGMQLEEPEAAYLVAKKPKGVKTGKPRGQVLL